MTHVTCRLIATNWDRLWNPTLGNRVWATFTFFMYGSIDCKNGMDVTFEYRFFSFSVSNLPSVFWRCWLGGRKGNRPVKKLSGGALAWLSVERGADVHMAQLMPLPLTVSCFSKIQIGFTFLVPTHPGSPGNAPLNRCYCSVSNFQELFNGGSP